MLYSETLLRYPAYILFVAILLAGCQQREDTSTILARVGDEVITVDEFILNYEFGHGHLRAGEQPKHDYLQFLIYEKLLAQEALKLELDTLPVIRHAMSTLQEELLIEQVFEEHVLAHVEVTEEEIRNEINRDAVSFKFRLLPAGSETEGMRLYEAMQTSSFEAVMEAQLEAIPELRMVEGELTSPYVRAEDLDGEIMTILQDLPVGQPSRPQQYQDAWYLFEVMDIRRHRLAEEDYQQKAPSYQKIIYNRKAMELGTQFVANTMQPLDVRTKRAGFEILNAALFAWYSDRIPERNLLYYIDEENRQTDYTALLVENYDELLVTYRDANWTVYDFLNHFTPGRYVIRPDNPEAFKARLADLVGLVVRDAVFLEMAENSGAAGQETMQRTTQQWKSKWLFQEYRKLLVQEASSDATAHVRKHAEALKDKYDVDVNWSMLDTLQTSVSAINPTMTVHLFKNNANKMPFPIADPNWRVTD